ncbi:MAG: PASTA domain-containing protein, partial [Erysipelotrichaceae bacterium]|nr:PASTA domain-containing protein [Erysipelotrichaceae bacterium]
PSLLSLNVNEAEDILEEYGSDLYLIGNGERIVAQIPEKGDDLYTGEKVFLMTDGNIIYVPDFIGWTRKDLISYWTLTKLPIVIDGYGVVYEQSTAPGTLADKKQEITVKLRDIHYPESDEEIIDAETDE